MSTAYENHGTIASERINTSFGYVTFWLTAEETVDFDNNGSNVTVKLMARADYGKSLFKLSLSGNISIGSYTRTYSGTYTIKSTEDVIISTANISIKHNVDGTKTIYSSTKIEMTKASYGFGGNIVLYDIQTGAILSCADTYIGETATINIIKSNPNYSVTITYETMDNTGYIEEYTTNSSVKWTIPEAFYTLIPNSNELEVTLKASTYDENYNLVDNSSINIMAKANPANCKPLIDFFVVDSNTAETVFLTGNNETFIRYYSKPEVDVVVTSQNGAEVAEVKVNNYSNTHTTNSSSFIITFPTIDSGSFSITAYDSRGFVNTEVKSYPMIPYVKLTCNLTSAEVSATGIATLNVSGNYYNGSFGKEENILYFQYRYKTNDEEFTEWASSDASPYLDISANTYEVDIEVSGLDYKNDYVFEVRAVDMLDTVDSTEKIYKTTPLFDWGKDSFRFNVPVTFTDGETAYNITGLAKAMTNVYDLETTFTSGINWTTSGASAILIGNSLRVYFAAKRAEAVSGNITNEEVLTLNVNTEDKITAAYNVSFSSGGSGPVSSFTTTNELIGSNLSIKVTLAATATSGNETSCYFIIPCRLNLDAY